MDVSRFRDDLLETGCDGLAEYIDELVQILERHLDNISGISSLEKVTRKLLALRGEETGWEATVERLFTTSRDLLRELAS